ncbi:MAG: PRC-barrel domain-containing protein [Candidatus Promineifilaceae bacterium]|nr:PRC-barrel domain-containing protein [Candidatus Promineifilaceae bacterium]
MNDIPIKANVECSDGHCGKSVSIIINPVNKKITHFVVEDSSLPDYETRLVPIEKVKNIGHDHIQLDCNRDDFVRMEPFITNRYVTPQQSIEDEVYWGADSYVDPLVIGDIPNLISESHIPRGELAVHRGMEVDATDGRIGTVDELVVDPEGQVVTHLLMRKGHLWGKKDVAIPIEAIESVYKDTVRLNVNRATVKEYPAISVKRLHSD